MNISKLKASLSSFINIFNAEKVEKKINFLEFLAVKEIEQDLLLNNFAQNVEPILNSLFALSPLRCMFFIKKSITPNTLPFLSLSSTASTKLIEYFLSKPFTFADHERLSVYLLTCLETNYYPAIVKNFKLSLKDKLLLLQPIAKSCNWPVLKSHIDDLLTLHSSPIVNTYVLFVIAKHTLEVLLNELNDSAVLPNFKHTHPHFNSVSQDDKKQLLNLFLSHYFNTTNFPNDLDFTNFDKKEKKEFIELMCLENMAQPKWKFNDKIIEKINELINAYFTPALIQYAFPKLEEKYLSNPESRANIMFSHHSFENFLTAGAHSCSLEQFLKLLNVKTDRYLTFVDCIKISLESSNDEIFCFLNQVKDLNSNAIYSLYPAINEHGLEKIDNFSKVDMNVFSIVKDLPESKVNYYLDRANLPAQEIQNIMNGAVSAQNLSLYQIALKRGADVCKIGAQEVFTLIEQIRQPFFNQLPSHGPEILKDIWLKENKPDFYLQAHSKNLIVLSPEQLDFLNIQKENIYLQSSLKAIEEPQINLSISNKVSKI